MPQRLVNAVREFTQALLNPFDLDELLHRLVFHAVETLPAAGAGILLEDAGRGLEFAVASGERVTVMEKVPDHLQAGVCYDAFVTRQAVVVNDLTAASAVERWPTYTERAHNVGFRAVIAMPLNAWGQTIGVLNVYRDTPSEWTTEDVEACQILAAMGAGYILNATRTQAQHELAENLRTALEHRGVIEQAKGIIMAQQNVDAEAAFARLREISMARNEKLRDIAREIVGQD